MPFTILNQSTYISSNWSGGTTTQLFIWPPHATYAARDFDLRISTARVEVEESEFTALPGYQRKLMILEGELKIEHLQHHKAHLKPLGVDQFAGAWQTTARGLCTDFNVMTRDPMRAELLGLHLKAGTSKQLPFNSTWKSMFIYLHTGIAAMHLNNQAHKIQQGELLVVTQPFSNELSLKAIGECLLAVVLTGKLW